MTERLLTIYNDIINDEDIKQVTDYFNNKCWLTKSDFGKLVGYFIQQATVQHTYILDIIFSSKKFAENADCVDKYGEPIVNCLLYALGGKHNKDYYFNLLSNPNIPFKWDAISGSLDTPLHVIAGLCDSYGKELTLQLFELAKEHGINPLDRNDADVNPMQIIRYDETGDNLTYEDRNDLVMTLERMSQSFVINVENAAYCAVEAN